MSARAGSRQTRVGRDDGVGRPLVDGIGQRQRQAAFGGLDVVRPNIVQALVVVAEPEAPLGLDRTRGRLVDHVGERPPFALGDLESASVAAAVPASPSRSNDM